MIHHASPIHTPPIPEPGINNHFKSLSDASALFVNSCSIFCTVSYLSAPEQLFPENFEIFIIVLKYLCMHIIEYTCRPFVAVPLGKTWREDILVFPEKSHSKLQSVKSKRENLRSCGNIRQEDTRQENIQRKNPQYKNLLRKSVQSQNSKSQNSHTRMCNYNTHNTKVFKEVGMFSHHAEHHAGLYGLQEFTLQPHFACENSFIMSSERRKHGKNSGN